MIVRLMAIISLNSFDQTVFITETQYFTYEAEANLKTLLLRKNSCFKRYEMKVLCTILSCNRRIWKLLYSLSSVSIRLQARRPEFDS